MSEKDVLEFLDSLPDEQKNAAGAKPDADILNFLDELAQESGDSTLKPKKADGESKEGANDDNKGDLSTKQEGSNQVESNDKNNEPVTSPQNSSDAQNSLQEKSSQTEKSNWWGGGAQLNSLWGSASTVVDGLSKTAQETVSDLSKVAGDLDYDYEKLGRSLNEGGEATIKQVGGIFSSFVNSLNEQIVQTTMAVNHHDETLKIFVINDELKNFNYIDYLIYNKFSKVIGQVDGSIDLEITNSKNFSKLLNMLDVAKLTNNDNDLKPKSIELFRGASLEAEKLSFANIDDGIKSLMQLKKSGNALESNSDRVSHIFITILPVIQEKSTQTYTSSLEEVIKIDETSTESFHFLVTLKDLEHKFSVVTKSQSFPLKWATWLTTNKVSEEDAEEGFDPADWVKDWVKDGLALAFAVLAQSYVSKRMGL